MREWDYQELQSKQTELFVLKQILDEYNSVKNTILYIRPSDSSTDKFGRFITRQDFIYQHAGLERLEKKGLIHVLDPSTLRGIHLSIISLTLLEKLYLELYESIPATGSLPRIVYSLKTGQGKINGTPFRFKRGSNSRKVFERLIMNRNKRLTRSEVWTAAGRSGQHTTKSGVIELTSIITNLRTGLKGISPDHLQQKQAIELHADVTLTD